MQERQAPSLSRVCLAKNLGVTATELLVIVAITAILASISLPALHNWLLSRRLVGISENYGADLHWARSYAVMSNAPVWIRFGNDGGGSCYVIYTQSANACSCTSTEAKCVNGIRPLKLVTSELANGISILPKGKATYLSIDPVLGTVTPTITTTFKDLHGKSISYITSLLGRTRVCTSPTAQFGHPAC